MVVRIVLWCFGPLRPNWFFLVYLDPALLNPSRKETQTASDLRGRCSKAIKTTVTPCVATVESDQNKPAQNLAGAFLHVLL